MKHLLLTTLFTAGIAALISCNNGDYLADPQGSIPNPPGLNGEVEEGVISCKRDSTHKYFRYGIWTKSDPAIVISGMILKSGEPVESIALTIGDFQGTGIYRLDDTSFGNSLIYHKLDADTIPTATYVIRDREGWAYIEITEASDTHLKGQFNGVAYLLDSTGEINREKWTHFRDGRFHVKRP
jgi:hypothetical protein